MAIPKSSGPPVLGRNANTISASSITSSKMGSVLVNDGASITWKNPELDDDRLLMKATEQARLVKENEDLRGALAMHAYGLGYLAGQLPPQYREACTALMNKLMKSLEGAGR